MTTITVTKKLDEDGITPIIKVPLTNVDQTATLFEEDWNLLVSLGVIPQWRFSLGHVVQRGKGRVSIARLIANVGKGEAVRFKDGDPLNLRRTNLINSVGGGKGKARSKLNHQPAIFQKKITIKTIEIQPDWMKQ